MMARGGFDADALMLRALEDEGNETQGRERERESEGDRSHCDAEEPIFWAAWRDATRYDAMPCDYHNNRRYYSVEVEIESEER